MTLRDRSEIPPQKKIVLTSLKINSVETRLFVMDRTDGCKIENRKPFFPITQVLYKQSVSYTHIDVYKRQPYIILNTALGLLKMIV